MSGGKKRILYIVSGILGGVLAFAGIELLFFLNSPGYFLFTLLQGAVVGAALGLSLGVVDDIAYSRLKLGIIRGSLSGFLTAVISAGVMVLAAQLYLLLAGAADAVRFDSFAGAPGGESSLQSPEFLSLVSRSAGWMLIGMASGAVSGFRRGSSRRFWAGILGGALGGLIGGVVLELLLRSAEGGLSAMTARLIGFLILGAVLGFALGEFERRLSFARLRVLTGANKNREYLLSGRETAIGSHMNAGVYLGDYEKILPRHALVVRNGEDMILKSDAGDVRINDGGLEGSSILKYQDVIQLGQAKLLLLQP